MTGNSVEWAETKKIAIESCGQVNVGAAKSVKEDSPDVPGATQDAGGTAEAVSDTAEAASQMQAMRV